MQQFDIPVLMLVFNRPAETLKVFNAVKAMRPKKLYVAADGPRMNKPIDAPLSEATRAIFNEVDWPCEVITLYRTQNLGCGPAVSGAISWFFEQEEMGIILEDDCLPHPDFFHFCRTLLLHYRDDERVMQICGSNFQQGIQRGDASYYFSMFSYIWGWATWRRAWEKYSFDVSNMDAEKDFDWAYYTHNKGIKRYFNHSLLYMKKGVINTWDYQWWFFILKHKGLSLVPNVNLITNIGNTDAATHGSANDTSWTVNQTAKELGQLVIATDVKIDQEADDYFYEKALKPRGGPIKKVIKLWRYLSVKLQQ